ncbi:MAG: murein L,D-transpeptidase, partial [Hyphomicrobiaceae bacterium]|nr:murein L,D-transpeptidase [Hyphomicrobiaceae bacterium]
MRGGWVNWGRDRVRRIAVLAVAAIVAIPVAVLSHRLMDWVRQAIDPVAIELERARRRAYAVSGQPLPGTPDLADLSGRLSARGLALGAPVFVRIFKREFELELWMQRGDSFERFAIYPICRWSGDLGPKLQEGDQQAPEGFYTVSAKALNGASRWHRAFDLGYPNAFDRAHARTGSLLMVHGGCASIGCFAMTDPVVEEIWRLITAALNGGQARFHVHVFPFRMTPENLASRQNPRWGPFWRELERGNAAFEATHVPPVI